MHRDDILFNTIKDYLDELQNITKFMKDKSKFKKERKTIKKMCKAFKKGDYSKYIKEDENE